MKRTIKEVYDLIKEKRKNSENDAHFSAFDTAKQMILQGERNAYQNVLSLIESSHLLEEDKSVKGSGLEIIENKIKDLMECVNECRTNGLEYSRLDDEIAELKIIGKELKALEIIKGLLDFDFAIRYGNNQPILRITNKLYEKLGKPFYYWELPITQEEYDLLKKVLL